jgi:antitoxin component YwqK of YwqJK toxin-antitoxin module
MRRIDIDDPDIDNDIVGRMLYQDELFTGEVVEYGDEGTIVSLSTYADGVSDGPTKTWYEDGSPESEGMLQAGLPVGETRQWYPNGQLKQVLTFERGEIAAYRRWAEDGTVTEVYPDEIVYQRDGDEGGQADA